MSTTALLKKSVRTGWFSLLLGTALLALFFFSNDLFVALPSAAMVLVLGAYNLEVLWQLLWRGQREKENRKALWRAGALLSLNVPVALLYTQLVLVLTNTLLVRLANDTKQPLRHMAVVGCGQPRRLPDLLPGQATIVWLPLSHDCFEHAVLVTRLSPCTSRRSFSRRPAPRRSC